MPDRKRGRRNSPKSTLPAVSNAGGALSVVSSVMPRAEIAARVTAIVGAAKMLRTEVHNTAMECLKHVEQHGDSTPARDMVVAIQKTGLNTRALVQWFEKYGNLKATIGDDNKAVFKKVSKEKVDLQKAHEHPYYENDDPIGRTKVDKPIEMSVHKALASLVRAMEKDAALGDGGIISIMDHALMRRLNEKREAMEHLVDVRAKAVADTKAQEKTDNTGF